MNKKSGGFTVVELLIGVVLTGLSVITFSILINSLNVLNDQARDLTIANGIIEEKIEDLRSQGFVALNDGTNDFTSELPGDFASPKSATYTISTVQPGLKSIKLDINYATSGKDQELDFTTYISELGLSQ